MPEQTPDELDRLYRAFRAAGTNGSLEIANPHGSLEITQGNGYLKTRLYIFGSPEVVMAEIARLHEEGAKNVPE